MNLISDIGDTEILNIYRQASNPELGCYTLTPIIVNGGVLSAEQREILSRLDRLIQAQSPLSEAQILYRGCSRKCFDMMQSGSAYPAFLSTSANRTEALRFTEKEKDGLLLCIQVPAGEKILPVSLNQENRHTLEVNEFLLGRNHRFEVLGESTENDDDASILINALLAPSIQEFKVKVLPSQ